MDCPSDELHPSLFGLGRLVQCTWLEWIALPMSSSWVSWDSVELRLVNLLAAGRAVHATWRATAYKFRSSTWGAVIAVVATTLLLRLVTIMRGPKTVDDDEHRDGQDLASLKEDQQLIKVVHPLFLFLFTWICSEPRFDPLGAEDLCFWCSFFDPRTLTRFLVSLSERTMIFDSGIVGWFCFRTTLPSSRMSRRATTLTTRTRTKVAIPLLL